MHGLIINKNIKVPLKRNSRTPLTPHYATFSRTKGVGIKKWPRVLKIGYESVGEIFKGDFADISSKNSAGVNGGRAEG